MTAPATEATASRLDPQRLLMGLGLLPLIGILILMLGIAFGVRGPKIGILALAVATSVLLAIPAVVDQARPPQRRHLLFALLSLMHVLYYVLPVFTRYLPEEFLGGTLHVVTGYVTPQDILTGQLAVVLAVLALMCGYATPAGRVVGGLLPAPRYDWSLRASLLVACTGVPLGWLFFVAAQFGALPTQAGIAIYAIFINFTLWGIALLVLAYVRYRSRMALLLLAVLIPISMALNFFTGSKGKFFGPLLMVFLAYLFVERRIRVSWVAAGVAAIALFYPASEFYRNVITDGLTRPAVVVLQDPGRMVRDMGDFASDYTLREWFVDGLGATASRFDGLAILSIILDKTPEEVPFQGGWTIGYAFLSLIPRAIWPGKPDMDAGLWVTDNYTLGVGLQTATGSTWIGEFYFNFGWIGIAIGMLIMGILIRILHEVLFRLGGTIPFLLVAVMLFNATIRSIGGGVLRVITGILFTALTVGSIHIVVRLLGGTVRIDAASRAKAPAAAGSAPGATQAPGPRYST